MKMAKASDRDFEAVVRFFEVIGRAIDGEYEDNSAESISETDEERMSKLIRREFRAIDRGQWGRVVWGFKTLVDNACDHTAKTLEWNEKITAALDLQRRLKSTLVTEAVVQDWLWQWCTTSTQMSKEAWIAGKINALLLEKHDENGHLKPETAPAHQAPPGGGGV